MASLPRGSARTTPRVRAELQAAKASSRALAARCRRLAKDYERLPGVLAGFHFLAFACLMVHEAEPLLASRP